MFWFMWSIDTRWFDVAVILGIFAAGGMLFGRFEDHKPRGRRLLKLAVVTAALIGIMELFGRWAGYSVIGLIALFAAYIHIWWLPSKGINGWTAEPRDKYLELVTKRKI